ncbi:30S ribosomal protein S8 [Candidatus Woesearchaeota archaeon]|nr:30S ribosomal protein S8 [Candidatus Woesearchaeota archaeon]
MTLNNTLANVLSHVTNYDAAGKKTLHTKFNSKIIKKILDIFKDEGYIGSYEEIKDSKGDALVVNLLGVINKTGVIRPNFQIGVDKIEYFEKRYLPARETGIMIISTNQGLMTHQQAKEKNIGGKLLAYCY